MTSLDLQSDSAMFKLGTTDFDSNGERLTRLLASSKMTDMMGAMTTGEGHDG